MTSGLTAQTKSLTPYSGSLNRMNKNKNIFVIGCFCCLVNLFDPTNMSWLFILSAIASFIAGPACIWQALTNEFEKK